jgi:rSAM/selenodomain-associated transferase 1
MTATIIFAKAPIPGYAKTRLIPALGADGAADIANRLLRRTVETVVAARLGPVILAATPEQTHPAWREFKHSLPDTLVWEDQTEGSLGDRLAQAAEKALKQYDRLLLVGTDCPDLRMHTLKQAASHLASADVCMVPVIDGGYALIGLRHFDANLFARIPWSTSDVAARTRERCYQLGLSLIEMPVMHDIDEPTDLRWLGDVGQTGCGSLSAHTRSRFNHRHWPA